MDEADKYLVANLKTLKVNIQKLDEFDSELFINTLIKCFSYISDQLADEDNFIDVKWFKKQNIQVQADKFRVCQKIQSYLKKLDYYNDISFNSFLFPNPKETRKILGFLFEIMFKEDEEDQDGPANQPSNSYEIIFKRRLVRFKNKPWILPEFLKIQRPLMAGGGDQIQVARNLDAQRMAECKSKKVKGIYEMMKALSSQDQQQHVNAYTSGIALSKKLNEATWMRG